MLPVQILLNTGESHRNKTTFINVYDYSFFEITNKETKKKSYYNKIYNTCEKAMRCGVPSTELDV